METDKLQKLINITYNKNIKTDGRTEWINLYINILYNKIN